ncbi:ribbon-helix-helix domain-containing protein [Ferrigenium sp. UT4]
MGYEMRTTIDIEDDVLAAAKELARMQNLSAGQVVSGLLRRALAGGQQQAQSEVKKVAGFRPFASRGVIVSNDIVDRLRDQEGA